MVKQNIKKHTFEPGAMTIIQMGEELIGHPSTALNELVKNGYDADALLSRVYIHYDKDRTKSFAFILDDGTGMNEATLFGDWLQPSFSAKRKPKSTSEVFHRHFLGSKGIGRLAAMALGQYTTVITKKAGESQYNWVTVDRESFRQEVKLSEVSFPGDKTGLPCEVFSEGLLSASRGVPANEALVKILENNSLRGFSNGTLVVVEALDESIIKILQDDFFHQTETFDNMLKDTTFYRSLATLITPLNLSSEIQKELMSRRIIQKEVSLANPASFFAVEFGTNLLPNQEPDKIEWQKIESIPIQSVFDYRVLGRVNESGAVDGYFSYRRIENDPRDEKLEISIQEIEDISLSDDVVSIDSSVPKNKTTEVGEYYFDIRVYDIGESDNLEKLARQSGLDSARKFKEAFKHVQGLRVSKNGFGVKPYGEQEAEDWIGLSKLRVQDPGHNVNTNQVLGYVFFYSPENDSLQEKTNREGFSENTAFIEVKITLKAIFKYIGRERYNYRLVHGLGRAPVSKHLRPDIQKFLQKINSTDSLTTIRKSSEEFMKDVTTAMDNLEDSLTFSERLASLGTGIELVYHEMAQPISRLLITHESLSLKKEKVQGELREGLSFDINSLADSTGVLSELRKSLMPAIGRSRKKKFRPYETFLKVCNLYKSDFVEGRISPKADERMKEYELFSQEYAFWIAFLNIVNNAVYWIKKSGRPGEIRLELEEGNIVVSNSGPPIREDILDYIFEYGVTTKNEVHATGLGLSFTRSILSTIQWQISAENRGSGPAFILKEVRHD
jgi:hypothetical protein